MLFRSNATGRLFGTLMSGVLYQLAGIGGCLLGSAGVLAACWAITLLLPSRISDHAGDLAAERAQA